MKLSDILSDLSNIIIEGDASVDICDIAYDSRKVNHGTVFVCIKGYKADGHDFVNDAVKNGAKAVVAERDIDVPEGVVKVKVDDTRKALALMSSAFFGHPTEHMKLIGVTGTNGKTTTTYILKSILEAAGYSTGLIGTINNIIGNRVIESKRTTPESYDLQKMFSEMKDANIDYCVMEVSSHSLALKRVEGCTFNVGIFTNLTRDHLDFHGTFENYFNAKMKLFSQSKLGAVNMDDSYSDRILEQINIPQIGYSIDKDSDVKAEDIKITSQYTTFKLVYKNQRVPVKLSLPGRFNVHNALAAASACILEGIPLEIIKKGLEDVKSIPGRSEVIDSKRGFTIMIDYAHTPDGLENILGTIHEYAQARIITVFGCGGDRDKTKRPEMGEIAGRLSDLCFVTSDNPRTEEPMAIINDILPGIKKTGCTFYVNADRKKSIKEALNEARENDIVLIAGKGHENYQEIGTTRIHFDEREIVNAILAGEL